MEKWEQQTSWSCRGRTGCSARGQWAERGLLRGCEPERQTCAGAGRVKAGAGRSAFARPEGNGLHVGLGVGTAETDPGTRAWCGGATPSCCVREAPEGVSRRPDCILDRTLVAHTDHSEMETARPGPPEQPHSSLAHGETVRPGSLGLALVGQPPEAPIHPLLLGKARLQGSHHPALPICPHSVLLQSQLMDSHSASLPSSLATGSPLPKPQLPALLAQTRTSPSCPLSLPAPAS